MTRAIIRKCLDCRRQLSPNNRKNKHHFRCEKCWFKFQEENALAPIQLPLKDKPLRHFATTGENVK